MRCLILVLLALPAWAETLTDTLITAYQNSPLLEVNRAALRATDETVAQARAAGRPQVDLEGQASLTYRDSQNLRGTSDFRLLETQSYSIALQASLLLYDGGATRHAIESAQAVVAQSRATLVSSEQVVLQRAATAFLDVRRDLQFVSLARNNVGLITEQLRAAQDRFEVGEVTRTDVSQAQARLAAANSNLSANLGALERSRQAYQNAVGIAPRDLAPPPPIPDLPDTLEDALQLSLLRNPDLITARFALRASEFDLRRVVAQADRMQVVGTASVSESYNPDRLPVDQFDTTIQLGVTATLPVYQGGNLASLKRQAIAIIERRNAELADTRRTVEQNVAFAWSDLEVARANIAANQREIEAARIAFEGTREEARLGARTTLDVLDAEQELLNARSSLVSSQRDEYVAAINLLAAIGLFTVEHLDLGIETYNPDDYYLRVQNAPSERVDTSIAERLSVVDRLQGRYGD